MKKFVYSLLMFLFIFITSFSAKREFIATADGYLGDIKVKVAFEENKLVAVDLLEFNDSDFTKKATEVIIKDIIDTQSLDVDNVAGATSTSTGLKDAVSKAVAQSKVKLVKQAKKVEVIKDTKTDVVVIGGGGAGLTAAIAAKEQGVNVILVEKMPILGGNTNYATGGLNAANTSVQKKKGLNDTAADFMKDTMAGGKNTNNPKLVETLTTYSQGIVEWLMERGADLSDLGRMAGQNADRTHRPVGGKAVGPDVVAALSKKADELKVDVRLNQEVVEIMGDKSGVKGVKVKAKSGQVYTINADAIVVATGGFGANPEMVVKYVPSLKGFGTTNHKGALGEGLTMLEKLGVDMVDMKEIQTHPTVVPGNNTMITEAVRGNGAILINRDGKRFINELETRDVVSAGMLKQKGGTAYLVFDQDVRKSLQAIEKYYETGLLTEGKTVEELAKKLNIPSEEMKKSMANYAKMVKEGKDTEFNRNNIPRSLEMGPFYAVEVGPAVHHTMGGVAIDTDAEVLAGGKTVPGLFAAGEVTGGIHGQNRLGGNAMADITIFGKIAGENAAKLVKSKKK